MQFAEMAKCIDKGSINFKRTFWYPQFFQKMNEKIQLYYYDTSGRLVFVRFLGEIEDTKKINK